MAACRSCGASIIWVKTDQGKRMALDFHAVDPERTSGPHFVIRHGDRGALGVSVPPAWFETKPEPAYLSHFATCPDSNAWRKRS